MLAAVLLTMGMPVTEARHHTFEALYAAHRVRVFQLCLRYGGGSSGWAEDVTHDVFIKLFEHLPRLSAHEDLGGWLYRVTSNLALRKLRDRSLFERIFSLIKEPEAHVPAPDQLVEHRQETARAVAAIQSLPPKERVVMSMKLIDGTSQNEIAEALRMSKGNVSKLLTRGREKLIAAGWEVSDDDA